MSVFCKEGIFQPKVNVSKTASITLCYNENTIMRPSVCILLQYPYSLPFSQPPISYGITPPYQVPSQPAVQQLQPGSQPWPVVGGQNNSLSGSLQPVQPSPASVSLIFHMKTLILQASELAMSKNSCKRLHKVRYAFLILCGSD